MTKEKVITILSMSFITILICSNISASNTVSINNFLSVSAAEILFPISYVINDLLVELFDCKKVTKIIIFGLFLSFFATVFLFLTTLIPSNYAEYNTVFGFATSGIIGISIASFFAYFVGSMINVHIMDKLKQKDNEKKFFKRAILSSIVAEIIDSFLFITFCCIFASNFYHWNQLLSFVFAISAIKIAVEIIVFPLTNLIKNKLQKNFAKIDK